MHRTERWIPAALFLALAAAACAPQPPVAAPEAATARIAVRQPLPMPTTPEQLGRYVGRYAGPDGSPRLSIERAGDGGLVARVDGAAQPLVAESAYRFRMEDGAVLVFDLVDDWVASVVVERGGERSRPLLPLGS